MEAGAGQRTEEEATTGRPVRWRDGSDGRRTAAVPLPMVRLPFVVSSHGHAVTTVQLRLFLAYQRKKLIISRLINLIKIVSMFLFI